jgi:magnesium-dependent phosphatase 1
MIHNFQGPPQPKTDPLLPTMIVFDLDDCLWTPEMHELRNPPTQPVQGSLNAAALQGVVGMKNKSGQTVRLYDGARKTLYELATNIAYKGILLAAASTSLEPSYSHLCLQGIEILPGLTLRNMLKFDQIGRSGRLNSDKITHFRLLQDESNVAYKEMLFFDDCNWGDHCGRVNQAFGIVSQRTPYGLTYKEFLQGLQSYRTIAEKRAA